MTNWKHTVAAVGAVIMVVSMTIVQFGGYMSVEADVKTEESMRNILSGDGRGETPEFSEDDLLDEAAFEEKTGYISYQGGMVNVREEASKDSSIISMIEFADSFIVKDISEDGLWYKISGDLYEGYVMCDLVTFNYSEIEAVLLSTTMYRTGKVSVSGGKLNVRNIASDINSFVIDQIKHGEIVYMDGGIQNGFYKVIFGNDYDTGYVKADYITAGEMVKRADIDSAKKDRIESISKKGYIVTNSSSVNVRTAPSENAPLVTTVKNGISVTVLSRGSKWTKLLTAKGDIAYIITSAVLSETEYADYKAKLQAAANKSQAEAKPTASDKGRQIVKEAEKYLGTRYVYGGNSPSGFDCSGFVQYTLKKLGIKVNRSSRDRGSQNLGNVTI